jgi:glycosyltransferase involved in cell wall biosynthesis
MVSYSFYEADNRVRRYAEALAKRGDEVDAISLRRDGQPSVETIRGVRVYRIQERRIDEKGPLTYLKKLLLFFFRSMWTLAVLSRSKRYDIVHVHSVPDFEVFATLIPRLMGTKVILDIHDIVPEFYASKFKVARDSLVFRLLVLIERLSISYSSHVIISNDLWKGKLLGRSTPPQKCTAIINYPDLSIFYRRPASRNPDEFVLCYPGTLNHHQGVDLAVRALSLLREQMPNLRLLIIGDGPDRDAIAEMVKRDHLEDCVTMRGSVTLETVADTMASVDLGIVPKRKESFGNEAFSTKILEFMSMGVPVLAADTRIDRYYFSDRLVEFFESDNASDLAAKILRLVRDSGRRNSLCEEATSFIKINNWDVRKGEYLSLVDRLVAGDVASQEQARCVAAK